MYLKTIENFPIKYVMKNIPLKVTKYFEHINRNVGNINIPTFLALTVVFLVKTCLTLRRLKLYIYIYGAPILDVFRSHTTTQHSR